jgi:hypothetical protein
MPVKDKIHEMFTPGKYLRIHYGKKTCNNGSYPKRNGLKKVVLQLFVPDIVKRVFDGFFYKSENFQHLLI